MALESSTIAHHGLPVRMCVTGEKGGRGGVQGCMTGMLRGIVSHGRRALGGHRTR
jgi:methyl coenzyme M reductase subunit C-like uncharacterized protein (methanogenesis marker protein 7)